MITASTMPSNHLTLCRPLLLPPSIFPRIKVFSSESALPIRRPKYRSFSFRISPSNEYSGLISFKIDGFDLLAVEGTFRSLIQHHSSRASIFQFSAFSVLPYVTPGKTKALTTRTFVGKVMLKILQARLQQYVNWELPAVQYGFRKTEEQEIKLPISTGS